MPPHMLKFFPLPPIHMCRFLITGFHHTISFPLIPELSSLSSISFASVNIFFSPLSLPQLLLFSSPLLFLLLYSSFAGLIIIIIIIIIVFLCWKMFVELVIFYLQLFLWTFTCRYAQCTLGFCYFQTDINDKFAIACTVLWR